MTEQSLIAMAIVAAIVIVLALMALRGWRRRGMSVRREFPRMFEIRDAMKTPEHADSYFRDFESSLVKRPEKRRALLKVEQLLSVLDDVAWSDIKDRALPLALHWVEGRGWEALFNLFNEIRGYKFLKESGCSAIQFVERKSSKTPDLEARRDGRRVLCEVKTFNVAEEEAAYRAATTRGEFNTREVEGRLDDGFLAGKLAGTIARAVAQIESEDPTREALRYVFCVINFNDWVGDNQPQYVAQIDDHLGREPLGETQVVFFLASNLFERTFTMRHATVLTD